MANMIRCDGCKKLFYDDSRTEKGSYVSVSITDVCGHSSYHLCRICFNAMMRNIFHMVWNDDEGQYIEVQAESNIPDCPFETYRIG